MATAWNKIFNYPVNHSICTQYNKENIIVSFKCIIKDNLSRSHPSFTFFDFPVLNLYSNLMFFDQIYRTLHISILNLNFVISLQYYNLFSSICDVSFDNGLLWHHQQIVLFPILNHLVNYIWILKTTTVSVLILKELWRVYSFSE